MQYETKRNETKTVAPVRAARATAADEEEYIRWHNISKLNRNKGMNECIVFGVQQRSS